MLGSVAEIVRRQNEPYRDTDHAANGRAGLAEPHHGSRPPLSSRIIKAATFEGRTRRGEVTPELIDEGRVRELMGGEPTSGVDFAFDAIARCHPRDPSWFQWPLLEVAIEGNIVADFPLCNKSFNCSYSGHDL